MYQRRLHRREPASADAGSAINDFDSDRIVATLARVAEEVRALGSFDSPTFMVGKQILSWSKRPAQVIEYQAKIKIQFR